MFILILKGLSIYLYSYGRLEMKNLYKIVYGRIYFNFIFRGIVASNDRLVD